MIAKDEVSNVALSAGFGFKPIPGVRSWMESKGFKTWADYSRAYKCVPRAAVQSEIETFVFGEIS